MKLTPEEKQSYVEMAHDAQLREDMDKVRAIHRANPMTFEEALIWLDEIWSQPGFKPNDRPPPEGDVWLL